MSTSSSSDPDYEDAEFFEDADDADSSSEDNDENEPRRRSARLAAGGRRTELAPPPPSPPNLIPGSLLEREVLGRSRPVAMGTAPPPPATPTTGVAALLRSREAATPAARPGFAACQRAHLAGTAFGPRRAVALIDAMHSRAYISTFSPSGGKLVVGFQDRRVRVYDASAGPAVGAATAAGAGSPSGVTPGYPLLKDIACRTLRWTVTDVALDLAESLCAYASICPTVHVVGLGGPVASVANTTEVHTACNLDEVLGAPPDARLPGFGIFSLRFAGDTGLLAGGTGGRVFLFDLARGRTTDISDVHGEEDVNAVAFLSPSDPAVFVAGSDDGLVRVVDRRIGGGVGGGPAGPAAAAAGSAGAVVSILVGHKAGITFIDTRGDGFTLLSTGKCQSTKLFDVRRPSPGGPGAERAALASIAAAGGNGYDYRFMAPPRRLARAVLPGDASIATYTGHAVQSTLIRARFSPPTSDGGAHVYSGSADGRVHIWDLLTTEPVAVLAYHGEPVRDVSWHPTEPAVLVSSSFDGTVVRWGAPGEAAMGVGGGGDGRD